MQKRGVRGSLQGEGLIMARHLQMKAVEAKVFFCLCKEKAFHEKVLVAESCVFANVALDLFGSVCSCVSKGQVSLRNMVAFVGLTNCSKFLVKEGSFLNRDIC